MEGWDEGVKDYIRSDHHEKGACNLRKEKQKGEDSVFI